MEPKRVWLLSFTRFASSVKRSALTVAEEARFKATSQTVGVRAIESLEQRAPLPKKWRLTWLQGYMDDGEDSPIFGNIGSSAKVPSLWVIPSANRRQGFSPLSLDIDDMGDSGHGVFTEDAVRGKHYDQSSLTEGERIGISITEGEVDEVRRQGENCLIGRYWTERKYNKEAFKNVLSRIWRMEGRVTFRELQDNLWIIEFVDGEDKRRILEGRPWSFDRQIFVLQEFEGNTPPSQMNFSLSPFWIQIHDMPLICMNTGVGRKIGKSMGQVEEVDVAEGCAGWGRYLCIRVILDLMKPLDRGRALHLGDKVNWVDFQYEKLAQFCYQCGCILHGSRGCLAKRSGRQATAEGTKRWGAWLKADDPGRKTEMGQSSKVPGEWSSPAKEVWGSDGERSSTGKEGHGNFGNPSDSSKPINGVSSDESSGYHMGNNSPTGAMKAASNSKSRGGEGKRQKFSLAEREAVQGAKPRGKKGRTTGGNYLGRGLGQNNKGNTVKKQEPMALAKGGPSGER
ncbi:uncharacterized protein LOC132165165 [Corylus avellana]|uniref:uncharacterized protein LOC132165165 n=1 Tax=Corylus avellana TaxID=13451 RepID=UPI00286BB4E5|nr:uncharacterized protein LOC132165165 [Corylus avellana]